MYLELPFGDCRLNEPLFVGPPLLFIARTRDPTGGKAALESRSVDGLVGRFKSGDEALDNLDAARTRSCKPSGNVAFVAAAMTASLAITDWGDGVSRDVSDESREGKDDLDWTDGVVSFVEPMLLSEYCP